jgi:hypothetical protein
MRRVARSLLPGALVLAFVLPSQDAIAWDGVQTLTRNRGSLALAGNEHGRRVAAWAWSGGVFVRVAPRGGRFGPTRRIAGPPYKSGVQVAMDERGDIALVWNSFVDADPTNDAGEGEDCCQRLMGAVLRRDGRLSRLGQLGAPGVMNEAALLGSDSHGHLALAFKAFDDTAANGTIYARFGTMRRGFGEPTAMSFPDDYPVPVSVGRGRVVYGTYGLVPQTVEASPSKVPGTLRRRVLLEFPIGRTQLGTDDSGRQTAAFENGVTATRSPPGAFVNVGQRDPGPQPLVSVAGSGAAAVVWRHDARILTSVRRPGGDFSLPLELDRVQRDEAKPGSDEVILGSVDSAPDGSAAIGVVIRHWQEPDPTLQSRLYVVPAGGGDGAERVVVDSDAPGAGIDVLHDARGTLVVAPTRDDFVAHWLR